jgi:hemerythrin-like metal-binding protein
MAKLKAQKPTRPGGKAAASRWRAALAVGVPAIDRQHRSLLAHAAEARLAVAAEKPNGHLDELLDRLIEAARNHFEWEEQLMVSSSYPGYLAHKKEHAMLLDEAQTLRHEFSSGQVAPGDCVTLFLDAWAEHHIARCDRPFAKFFQVAQAGKAKPTAKSGRTRKRVES